MFQAFIIVCREVGELLLVIFALLGWARSAGRPVLVWLIFAGVLTGFVIAAAIVAALPATGMDEWFSIALTFGFGLSLAIVSSGTMASVAGIGGQATRVLSAWSAHRAAGVTVLAFAAFSALREALEAFLLLRFVAARETAEDLAWGITLGFVACALLTAAWQGLRTRRGAHWVFRLSAVILFVLGMQMMIEAVSEVLMRGIGGDGSTQLGYALKPYLENGDRYWMLCLALATIPLLVWTRTWWRRAGD